MDCGVSREDAPKGRISTRGLCSTCSLARQLENDAGIEHKLGVPYERWKIGVAMSILPREVVGELYKAGLFKAEVC